MTTLADCRAAGIPVYRFGSPELADLHDAMRDPPCTVATRGEGCYMGADGNWYARRTYSVLHQTYAWHAEGCQYVVDHGGFHTLNTFHAGQVVPTSEFLSDER